MCFQGGGVVCICNYIAIHIYLYRCISLSLYFFTQWKENYLPLLQPDLDTVCAFWPLKIFIVRGRACLSAVVWELLNSP